jgi:cytochrome c-type biogenesis protein CcmH
MTLFRRPRSRLVVVVAAWLVVGLVLFVVDGQPSLAQAPAPEVEDEMYRIADKLNCPICQGQRLSECPIQICVEMREEIVQRLRAGEGEQEIIQAFVDRYGMQVLNQPPAEGFNLLAWVVPFIGLAVVLGLGGWALRRWSRARVSTEMDTQAPRSALETTELPEEYLRRLEDELDETRR